MGVENTSGLVASIPGPVPLAGGVHHSDLLNDEIRWL